MTNHLGPFPEPSDGPEWQEQTVRAVGGQGELQGVTFNSITNMLDQGIYVVICRTLHRSELREQPPILV